MAKRVRQQLGFTLLEVMAVIMIIGLAIGGVSLGIGFGGKDRELEDAIERFMAVAAFASEKAILSGQTMGLLLEPPEWQAEDKRDQEGLGWRYRWRIYAEETGWQDLENLQPLAFPLDLTFEVEIDELEWDWEKILIRDEPIVAYYPSGDVTPFMITITHKLDAELVQHIEVNEEGDMVWRELQELREAMADEK